MAVAVVVVGLLCAVASGAWQRPCWPDLPLCLLLSPFARSPLRPSLTPRPPSASPNPHPLPSSPRDEALLVARVEKVGVLALRRVALLFGRPPSGSDR